MTTGAIATFGSVLTASRGRTNGFDYLRVLLSISVIATHVPLTTYGEVSPAHLFLGSGWFRPFAAAIVPIFFALSGFLVAGSLARSKSLWEFCTLRVIRLFPALCIEVLISAVIMGALMTALPLSEYFTNMDFFAYFENILGDIHYTLPGLFLENPLPQIVNGQLWTIPSEMKCYTLLVGLAVVGIAFRPRLFLCTTITLTIFMAVRDSVWQGHDLLAGGHGQVQNLFLYFLSGVAVFQFRDRIPMRFDLFLACCFLSYALLSFQGGTHMACFLLAYITVYIGLSEFRPTMLTRGGDYSYGLYLYGFPVQQAVADLLPAGRVWWLTFPISLLISFIFAWLSWNLLEVKILHRKKDIVGKVEKIRLSTALWFGQTIKGES